MPECVALLRYQTGSGIVIFFNPVLDCQDARRSGIPAVIAKFHVFNLKKQKYQSCITMRLMVFEGKI
jgi:hypothetical protein